MEVTLMVAIACPWCEEDVALAFAELAREPDFVCSCCATSVALTADEKEPLESAA
jgi:hypothetical protein